MSFVLHFLPVFVLSAGLIYAAASILPLAAASAVAGAVTALVPALSVWSKRRERRLRDRLEGAITRLQRELENAAKVVDMSDEEAGMPFRTNLWAFHQILKEELHLAYLTLSSVPPSMHSAYSRRVRDCSIALAEQADEDLQWERDGEPVDRDGDEAEFLGRLYGRMMGVITAR